MKFSAKETKMGLFNDDLLSIPNVHTLCIWFSTQLPPVNRLSGWHS